MNNSRFVYVTYIKSTPEQIWKALLNGEFTREYWAHDNVSDWKPGSPWQHVRSDETRKVDLVGEVVENTPPERLVLTWAFPGDAANKAKHSRVTFELEKIDAMVRLTVTHDELEQDSDMLRGITEGWPRVLASLKTLLETGHPLPTWAKTASK